MKIYINTHHGLYIYAHLPFGVPTAPAVFQQMIDAVLQRLSKVLCYLDDILITGTSDVDTWTTWRRFFRDCTHMVSRQ